MSRRIGIVLVYTVLAYLISTTGFVMLSPALSVGEPVLTADQQTQLNTDTVKAEQLAFDAKVSSYLAWHHCETLAGWHRRHPNQIPARMVQHADGSGRLEQVAWTYPAARGEWVVGFCG